MIDAGLLPAPLPTPVTREEHENLTMSLASKATMDVDYVEEGLGLRLVTIGMRWYEYHRMVRTFVPPTPLSSLYPSFVDFITENYTFLGQLKASSSFLKTSGRRAKTSR